jgi:hypothetical protein
MKIRFNSTWKCLYNIGPQLQLKHFWFLKNSGMLQQGLDGVTVLMALAILSFPYKVIKPGTRL